VNHPATLKGVQYLIATQKEDGTWNEPYFTGTGFPGYGVGERVKKLPKPGERGYQGLEMSAGFMINYHLYRNIWPLLALGRYRTLSAHYSKKQQMSTNNNPQASARLTKGRD
jgi:squalene-hopene/tetraprenyl-beta-curcumene cyclase